MRSSVFDTLVICLVSAVGATSALAQAAQESEPVSIVTQPADQTVEVGRRATLTVEASGSSLHFQWFVNNTRITSATNSSYLTPTATLAMNGWLYHVVVSNALGPVTSDTATLTVVPDETGPALQYAVVTAPTHIEIQFDEFLLRSTATNFTNYSLFVLGTTNRIAITNALLAFNRVRVVANQMLNPLSNYVVCLANITDIYTNLLAPNPACIGVGFPETNRVVSLGALWRYNDNATNTLPAAWKTLDYDDDPFAPPYHWAEGYGAFGYSSSPNFLPCSLLTTPLSSGVITYYFRKRFILTEDYPADTIMKLRYEVDDGAVFYLNGAEVYRTTNMPGGIVNHFTLAGHVSTAACVTVAIPIPENVIANGMNLLAVEVHQAVEQQPERADVVFDAELTLEYRWPPIVPELRLAYGNAEVVLTWEGDGWSLQTAESVFGPWSRLSTSDNRYVSPLSVPGEHKFFRLVNP
jgi:hypothetical protein